MIIHTPGSPARVVVVAVGIALASAGPLSARAEHPASPRETAGLLATLSDHGLVADDAPMCRIDDPDHRSARIDTGAQIAQIRALIAADAAASGASGAEDEFVAISNRGYNYQPDTLVDPALIEFEARHQGR